MKGSKQRYHTFSPLDSFHASLTSTEHALKAQGGGTLEWETRVGRSSRSRMSSLLRLQFVGDTSVYSCDSYSRLHIWGGIRTLLLLELMWNGGLGKSNMLSLASMIGRQNIGVPNWPIPQRLSHHSCWWISRALSGNGGRGKRILEMVRKVGHGCLFACCCRKRSVAQIHLPPIEVVKVLYRTTGLLLSIE